MSKGILDGNIGGLYVFNLKLNPASVAANTCAEQDFTVPGVQKNDVCLGIQVNAVAGLGMAGWRVKSNNTITVNFVNATAAPIDMANSGFTFLIARPDVDQAYLPSQLG